MKLTNTSKTYKNDDKNWILIDAEDKTLGRLSTKIANILRGKNKATYTPNADCGDFVIVINSEKIKLSGQKLDKKIYYKDTKYIGGLKQINARKLLEKDPSSILYTAVKGMLPKTKLSDRIIKKLKIYKGSEHNHAAQKPEIIEE
jgi:large subunit ribosomal protein L13